MSVTLFTLVAAAAPVALREIGNYAKENRAIFNGLLKQSKPVIRNLSEKLQNEVNKYEKDGWEKE